MRASFACAAILLNALCIESSAGLSTAGRPRIGLLRLHAGMAESPCGSRATTHPILMADGSDPSAPPSTPPAKAMSVRDATAIIGGTAIGGGILALPTVTTPMGFLPTVFGLGSVWVVLAMWTVVYVEACGRILVELRERTAQSDCEDEIALLKDIEERGLSVPAVATRAMGKRVATVCCFAFVMQMLAVLTAQVRSHNYVPHALCGSPLAAATAVAPSDLAA
jgi:hypothetical protein